MTLFVALLWLSGNDFLLPVARRVGYAVCHQLPSHSYTAWGIPLPLCARCTGQYLGVLLVLGYILWLGGRNIQRFPTRPALVILGGLVIAWAVDGLNSYLDFLGLPHLYTPQNVLRLLTGMGEGVALMALFWPLFAQVTWPVTGREQLGARDIVVVLGIGYASAFLIHVGDGRVRYAFGLLSALGVLIVMTLLFSTLLRLATHRVGTNSSRWERGLFLVGGLMVAVLVVMGVGVLRDLLPQLADYQTTSRRFDDVRLHLLPYH